MSHESILCFCRMSVFYPALAGDLGKISHLLWPSVHISLMQRVCLSALYSVYSSAQCTPGVCIHVCCAIPFQCGVEIIDRGCVFSEKFWKRLKDSEATPTETQSSKNDELQSVQ